MSVVVRTATGDDRGFLIELSEDAFDPYSRNPGAVVQRMMSRGGGAILIAEDATRRLGFAVVALRSLGRPFGPWAAPRLAHLDAIAVRPDARGKGTSRLLLRHAEDFARDHGAVSMSLLTAKTNVVAQSLFRTSGYQPILPIAAAYIDDQAGISMLKSLSLRA